MDLKQEILDIPRALSETLEKGRAEYDALVRQTRWGDGPIFMVGSGASVVVGLAGAYAFESLLGWPVVVREAALFETYSAAVLHPRSVLLAISESGESPETLAVARAARSQGATVLALTNQAQSKLAKEVDGVFLVRAGEEPGAGARTAVCQQAALSHVALVAARALQRHQPQTDALEAEFEKLPESVEWALTQFGDAVRSFASELERRRSLHVVGGGFYHPAALHWAGLLQKLTGIEAWGHQAQEVAHGPLEKLGPDAAIVFLSGSRCRVKRQIHRLAEGARKARASIFAVTDGNDRELADRAQLAVLLPILSEMVGPIVSLALLDWVAYHVAHQPQRDAGRFRPKPAKS
jgi:glucosamine--fructose-6-phosphate aminotransferase (isomerizing)